MRLEMAAGDPLLGTPCLLCGERFEAEGYSERFRPEILPGVLAGGFAPGIYAADGGPLVGYVCPSCFGDGGSRTWSRLCAAVRSGSGGLQRLWKRVCGEDCNDRQQG